MRSLFPVTDQTPARGPEGRGRAAPADDRAPGRGDDRAPGRGGDRAPDRGDDRAHGRGGEPAPAPADDREWSLDELADRYAYPETDRPVLRANMVSTLDGAAMHDGRSQPISCPTDMRIFGTLRGLADAVVVGAETVRQEGYRPARARDAFAERRAAAGQGPAPAIAVISASLDLDFSLPLFTEPLVPTLLLTGAAASAERRAAAEKAGARVLIAGEGRTVEPGQVVDVLAEQGLKRLLTEGGPTLLGQFVAADVLDELCLTVSPMLAAGDARRIAGGPRMTLPERFSLASVLEEDGFLFTRYRRP
ncbi:pyrimidine reductase family protein [Streptomyces luteolus]|uniref:Pyrimidine reductase family protein n=1 Tax=Streptomyces luteolus TaxID=3043615 RepID=A0ABT6SUM1_9ACTN|nr:pyrimidine reductase family protein [Streptomyces sp. B-S-A12]MDI3419302.1 pyrimidine reductase family protein [Streptomyces sp. B-S-A12]